MGLYCATFSLEACGRPSSPPTLIFLKSSIKQPSRSQQQSVQEEIMKKFREIVREASQAVYGNRSKGGEGIYDLC